MESVVCPQCGRSFGPNEPVLPNCPSCGFALTSLPVAAQPLTPPIAATAPTAPEPQPQPPMLSPNPQPGYAQPAPQSVQPPQGYPQYAPPTQPNMPPYMGQQPSVPTMPYGAPPVYPQAGMPGAPYPGGPMGPGMGVPPQPQQRKSKTGLILGIVGGVIALVLILVVVAGVALSRAGTVAKTTPTATATLAATATPSIPSGFQLYSDSNKVYTLDVPQDWKNTSVGSSGQINVQTWSSSSAVTPSNIGIFQIEYVQSQLDPQSAANTYLQEFGGKLKNKQGPTQVTIGGQSWTQVQGDAGSGGIVPNAHIVAQAINHGSYTVIIGYLAGSATYSDLNTQDFQPMVNSFQFAS